MDSTYYELNNVMEFLRILPEQEANDQVVFAIGNFLRRTLEIIASEFPMGIRISAMQTSRSLLLHRLQEIAEPLGFNPAIIRKESAALYPTPLPPSVSPEVHDLVGTVDEMLALWDQVGVLGIASKTGKGVKELLEVIPRLKTAHKRVTSLHSS